MFMYMMVRFWGIVGFEYGNNLGFLKMDFDLFGIVCNEVSGSRLVFF